MYYLDDISEKVMLLFVMITLTFTCFAYDLISELTSYLGKPSPSEFRRSGVNTFIHDDKGISLRVENGLVNVSTALNSFDSIGRANAWVAQYHDYFDHNDWILLSNDSRGTAYHNNEVMAMLVKAWRREDGLTVSTITLALLPAN